MPRGPRLDTPGALHHVIARGIERRPIFLDDRDHRQFRDRLAVVLTDGAAALYAWCLMPNHVHLLLRTGTQSLSTLMRRLPIRVSGRRRLVVPPDGGILLHWRDVTPFGIESGDQFRSDPPPALTSNAYRKDYDEVKTVGELASPERPQDRSDVARYFAVATALHVWNQAASQVSAAQGKSLSENARAFALLNMAISDALVASIETKYHYIFWRPLTAIRAGDSDGNPRTDPDPAWTPFITTPCFPSYPSAHAAASYAGRAIAERIFGPARHDIVLTHPGVPGVTLVYTKFQQITADIDDARVYGGIHFDFDQEAGARQGARVGTYVYKNTLGRSHEAD